MKDNPLISIVLPTYNVAPFLKQCLESVANQTYENYEAIIIVDGATDGSYEIAQKFCDLHSKFTVVWQENAGSGPARNNGIKHANGDFVMFVDPDDWIDSDLLEKLYEGQKTGDYDLVATMKSNATCDENGEIISFSPQHYKEREIIGKEILRNEFLEMMKNGVIGEPTNKLYKMSIIKEYGVDFPPLRRSQDIVFNYRYYNCIDSIKFLSYSGYNYRIELTNTIGRTKPDYYKTILFMYNDFQELYKSWGRQFPDNEICNFFFKVRLNTNLQRCVSKGWDIRSIVEEPTIHHIIEASSPNKTTLKFLRILLLGKHYRLIKFYLSIITQIKLKGLVKK